MVLVWTPLINSLSGGGLLAWRDTSPRSPPRYSSANKSACVGMTSRPIARLKSRVINWTLDTGGKDRKYADVMRKLLLSESLSLY